jgi:hypothetical protein
MARRPARPASAHQPDLLDWTPPVVSERFAEHEVRAASAEARVSRAVATVLRDAAAAGLSRDQIAERMSEYLDHRITRTALDAYASEARDDRTITTVRLLALLHATRDRRLLELLAEPFGWVVIERRHLPLIHLAAVQDQQERLRKEADALRHRARMEGVL